MTRDVLIAAVIGAHGLKGEVKLKLFTETPQALARYGHVHAKDGRVFTVTGVKSDAAAFAEVTDRNAAEALKGLELFVARDVLPAAGENEFYHADLIGLAAMDNEDRVIGTVKAIHNYGAGDVIEIARGEGDTVLLPFARDFVPVVDIANARVVIALPEETEAPEEIEVGEKGTG